LGGHAAEQLNAAGIGRNLVTHWAKAAWQVPGSHWLTEVPGEHGLLFPARAA